MNITQYLVKKTQIPGVRYTESCNLLSNGAGVGGFLAIITQTTFQGGSVSPFAATSQSTLDSALVVTS